jgi:8-oxo-dGTP pyrophosphatase MutT (NUDIX family)
MFAMADNKNQDHNTGAQADDERRFLRWKAISSEVVADCEVFFVHKTVAATISGEQRQSHFHTIKCGSWVVAIALSKEREVVIVEQYRHGIQDLTLELPGGCIDETDSSPELAAKRELIEETGYHSESWSALGGIHPNPAIMDNQCHFFLAENVHRVEDPKFDETGNERIHCHLIPLAQIDNLIRERKITHSLVISAFHLLKLERPDLWS